MYTMSIASNLSSRRLLTMTSDTTFAPCFNFWMTPFVTKTTTKSTYQNCHKKAPFNKFLFDSDSVILILLITCYR